MVLMIAAAAFLAVASAVGGVALLMNSRWREPVESRLDQLVEQGRRSDPGGPLGPAELPWEGPQRLEHLPWLPLKLRRLAAQSGVTIAPQRLLAAVGILAGSGAVLGLAGPLPWLLAPLGAAAGAAAPIVWLLLQRRSRLKKFESQLPDALDLLARSLRAGHSLADGIRLIGEELAAPAGEEFGRCFEQQNLGVSWDMALDHLAVRVPNADLRFFVTAMVLQRETGGDTAELLAKIARLVRERFQLRAQVKALTGEGRLSGVVLLALPILLGIYMYFQNPKYLASLFDDPLGQQMVAAAAVAQIVGAIVIKKLVDIEV